MAVLKIFIIQYLDFDYSGPKTGKSQLTESVTPLLKSSCKIPPKISKIFGISERSVYFHHVFLNLSLVDIHVFSELLFIN